MKIELICQPGPIAQNWREAVESRAAGGYPTSLDEVLKTKFPWYDTGRQDTKDYEADNASRDLVMINTSLTLEESVNFTWQTQKQISASPAATASKLFIEVFILSKHPSWSQFLPYSSLIQSMRTQYVFVVKLWIRHRESAEPCLELKTLSARQKTSMPKEVL